MAVVSRRHLAAVAVTIGSCLAVRAQSIRDLPAALASPAVLAALTSVETDRADSARLLADLGAIVSPSGHEHARAEAVAGRMREIGLVDVHVDDAPNAIGAIRGRSGKAFVFVSTLDDLATVADQQRAAPHPPMVNTDRVDGPGTNTSSTTASLLAAARALVKSGLKPEHDLVFAAVAQEETGLVGMKRLYQDTRSGAIAYVDVLGDGHSISYGALGIHWWKIVATGPAGHTLNGGLPNVNQAIGRAVDRILSLPQPALHKDRRTVINVSILSSGAVFNHKPETGWFSLDVRSLDAAILDDIERDVRTVLAQVSTETGIGLAMEPFQMTPGGQIPGARDSDLVRTAEAISRHLGFDPTLNDSGSSNMNVAIGGGTPAIGIGGNRGGRRSYPDEWADIPAMLLTAKHVVLLAATIGGAQ